MRISLHPVEGRLTRRSARGGALAGFGCAALGRLRRRGTGRWRLAAEEDLSPKSSARPSRLVSLGMPVQQLQPVLAFPPAAEECPTASAAGQDVAGQQPAHDYGEQRRDQEFGALVLVADADGSRILFDFLDSDGVYR